MYVVPSDIYDRTPVKRMLKPFYAHKKCCGEFASKRERERERKINSKTKTKTKKRDKKSIWLCKCVNCNKPVCMRNASTWMMRIL